MRSSTRSSTKHCACLSLLRELPPPYGPPPRLTLVDYPTSMIALGVQIEPVIPNFAFFLETFQLEIYLNFLAFHGLCEEHGVDPVTNSGRGTQAT